MHATFPRLQNTAFPSIKRTALETLQVNLGYKCNQSCLHCHVNAGPNRKEMMDDETVDLVIDFLSSASIKTVDLTGGAPELHPRFKQLVSAARELGLEVIDRCNLTVLLEQGQEDTAQFLADNQVKIVASLPCYIRDNVDNQRGDGVFEASLAVLQMLNRLGYGIPGTGLVLGLVYNPQGPVLPPPQEALEEDYKKHLSGKYGVSFNYLLTLSNMPIKRFGSTLVSKGEFDSYMSLLRTSHRDENLEAVMCRSLLSVDWQGYVYDCDFNQMLELPILATGNKRLHLRDVKSADMEGAVIRVADHCYGCTAGQGSSCSGALE